MRTVLCSWAHPDDESFMAGALLCSLAGRGVRTVLSVATRGEAGTAGDPPVCSRAELGAVRERELRDAASILGVHHVAIHGVADRELASADGDGMLRRLVAMVREYKPEVVLTFAPDGFNRHPDHVAVSSVTSDAIAAAADPRWFPESGAAHEVQRLLWTTPLHIFDVGSRPDLAAEPGIDFLLDATPWRGRKIAALRAHRTQHASVERHFGGTAGESTLRYEVFRQAWGPQLRHRPEADVLAGLRQHEKSIESPA